MPAEEGRHENTLEKKNLSSYGSLSGMQVTQRGRFITYLGRYLGIVISTSRVRKLTLMFAWILQNCTFASYLDAWQYL